MHDKNPNNKRKPSFTKWCNFCRQNEHSIADFDKNNKLNPIDHHDIRYSE